MTGPTVGAVQARELTIPGKPVTGYAVSGTPMQAVTHAMVELTDRRPDLCVSGANYGENIGSGVPTASATGARPGTSPAGSRARSCQRASPRTLR
jgi:5'-nucleotidase